MFQFLKSGKDQAGSRAVQVSIEAYNQLKDQNQSDAARLSSLRTALEKVSIAITLVDRDLTITYANTRARLLLQQNSSAVSSLLDNADASQLAGTSIARLFRDILKEADFQKDAGLLPLKPI